MEVGARALAAGQSGFVKTGFLSGSPLPDGGRLMAVHFI